MHCPPDELDQMLEEYYSFRGWDPAGKPEPETLERLGLSGLTSG
jgi:aldehyde:ferredoxin oxidoreductase